MQKIIDKLNEAFLPKNLECDGTYCTGCWKDVIREAIRMIEEENALQKQQEYKYCNCKEGKQGRTVDEKFNQICDVCGGY